MWIWYCNGEREREKEWERKGKREIDAEWALKSERKIEKMNSLHIKRLTQCSKLECKQFMNKMDDSAYVRGNRFDFNVNTTTCNQYEVILNGIHIAKFINGIKYIVFERIFNINRNFAGIKKPKWVSSFFFSSLIFVSLQTGGAATIATLFVAYIINCCEHRCICIFMKRNGFVRML